MKKMITYIGAVMLLVLVLTGCCLSHDWQAATCDAPKTCAKCGETEGEKLEHVWVEATCNAPKTCSACGATEGEKLEHDWSEETCAHAQICNLCGAEGNAALEHEPGDWVVVEEATTTKTGMKEKYCEACGEKLEELEYIIPEGELPSTSFLYYADSGQRRNADEFAQIYGAFADEIYGAFYEGNVKMQVAEDAESPIYDIAVVGSDMYTLVGLSKDREDIQRNAFFNQINIASIVEVGDNKELHEFFFFATSMMYAIDSSVGDYEECYDMIIDMAGELQPDVSVKRTVHGVTYSMGILVISADLLMLTFMVEL